MLIPVLTWHNLTRKYHPPDARDILDFNQADIEKWVAKKAAKTVAERLVRGRAATAGVEALDDIAAGVKSGSVAKGASVAASEESSGMLSKAKEALKEAKDSAVDSAKSSAKDSVKAAVKGDAAKAATTTTTTTTGGEVAGGGASTASSTAKVDGPAKPMAAAEGGEMQNVGSVRDAAFIGCANLTKLELNTPPIPPSCWLNWRVAGAIERSLVGPPRLSVLCRRIVTRPQR